MEALRRERPCPAWVASLIASAALGLGVACYLVLRSGGTLVFPWGLGLGGSSVLAGSLLAGSLPSLLHTFAFALLGAAALGFGRGAVTGSAVAWAVIGGGFEVLQHDRVAAALFPGSLAPMLADGGGLAALLARYAHGGVFDPADVAATLVGAALAWRVGTALSRRRVTTGGAQP